MACYKTTTLPAGMAPAHLSSYTTEAECLAACKEGACCEGQPLHPSIPETCAVKPMCQCQGAGKSFAGIGTTCSPNPCASGTAGNPLP